ncbi:hypothetical protein [Blastococcus sp. LR1]|uniref:hypothetical protein n=1 Tax=Blastococcus sp. LR1 TaxID=2877000 RepID=UPI001CCB254E|nr:hypothetical protein [Blastococcus sp. LR1]MCA0144102.1 hypothetical protein [Blastococcus sp. LR1]
MIARCTAVDAPYRGEPAVNEGPEPTEPSGGGLIELMQDADSSWTTARGVWRHWRRHDLVLLAFDQHFARLAASGSAVWESPTLPSEGSRPAVVEALRTVTVDRNGTRVRVERLSSQGDDTPPDLLVLDGPIFWVRTGPKVSTNVGDPGLSHGGAEALALLRPGRLPKLFELRPVSRSRVAGRHCYTVTLVPRAETQDQDPAANALGMIAGGDEFVLEVDVLTGLVLRATKIVDGLSAEIHEWLSLELDVPVADSDFAPLTATT